MGAAGNQRQLAEGCREQDADKLWFNVVESDTEVTLGAITGEIIYLHSFESDHEDPYTPTDNMHTKRHTETEKYTTQKCTKELQTI